MRPRAIRIAPQRASEVDDDLVVGPAIPIDGSPIDEDTLRRGIQNPVDKWPGGSRTIADRRVQESSAEQERPAEPALTQVSAQCEVRRLDEHRSADSASRVGRRADPVRHAVVPRRRLADEQSVVLNVLDPAELSERGGFEHRLELPGGGSGRRKYGQYEQAKGGATQQLQRPSPRDGATSQLTRHFFCAHMRSLLLFGNPTYDYRGRLLAGS